MTRAIPIALKAHYALGTTTIAECWKATLQDGTIVCATTHSEPITIDGDLYLPTQAYNPSQVENSSDLSVDNMEVDGYLSAPQITIADVYSGRWDYAEIELFEINYRDLTNGKNILRSGTLGQVKAGRTIFTAELRGLTQKLARRIIMLTTQECTADLGDAHCKISLASWTRTGTVQSETNNKIILDPARNEPTDFFTGGLITFTSGLNEGLSMEVKAYSPGRIELHEGMPFTIRAADDPVIGSPMPPDTYSVYAGCQKRFYQDCIGKFNNGLNFRGFPHLPGSGVFGGPGAAMTPATVPGNYHQSPPPVVPGSPPPPPAGSPDIPGADGLTYARPAGSINLADQAGAVPDGTTNNLSAINAALAAAGVGGTVWVPPGTWAWSGNIINLVGRTITGAGATSILYALDYTHASIFMSGDGATVSNLKLTGAAAPNRQSPWEMTKIHINGATNFTISNNVIEDAPAASIQSSHSAGAGVITHNTIRRSLADSIHNTDGAHDITVSYNLIENSGDDGVAVVSYASDATACFNIVAHDNKVVNNDWGRNMSIVGGSDIHYYNNYMEGNAGNAAGLYIAKENNGSFVTRTVHNVIAENNTIKNCGGTNTGHAGIMLFSDGPDSNDNILLKLNDINEGGLPGVNGIRVYGPQTNIQLDQNRYTGTGQALVNGGGGTVITLNTPYSSGTVGYVPPAPPPPPPGPPASPPPPSTGSWGTSAAGIDLLSDVPFIYLATGGSNDYWIDTDEWGTVGLSRGTYTGDGGYTFEMAYGRLATPGPNGEGGWRSAWKFPDTTTAAGHEVKAYPNATYGAKPGLYSTTNKPGGIAEILNIDGTISSHIGGITPTSFLPIKADMSMRDINVTWNYHHNVTPSGHGHFSFDIFWQNTPDQGNYFGAPPITHEIMIPLNYWGNYGAYNPPSRGQPYMHDVVINGLLFHVYYASFFGNGWRFIVFEPDGPFAVPNPGSFNLKPFFQHIISNGWWNGNEYLSSISLGVEPQYGVGDIECTGYRIY